MTAHGGGTPPPAREPGADARPSRRKKLRKEEIVTEATRLFAERGYEGTSMGDLAQRVGLRKASLFHHFESKDLLYATVLGQLLAAIQSAILRAATAEGTFTDRLDALTDSITTALGDEPHAARLLMREAMDFGPVMRDQLAGPIDALFRSATSFAKEGQKEGVFNPALDPEHLVVSLVGIYVIPFVIDRTVGSFLLTSPFESAFIEQRRQAIREQIRMLMLVRP